MVSEGQGRRAQREPRGGGGSLESSHLLNAHASSYYYVLAGVYRRLGMMDESRKALETFKRLEQESAELDKHRRGAGAPQPKPREPA